MTLQIDPSNVHRAAGRCAVFQGRDGTISHATISPNQPAINAVEVVNISSRHGAKVDDRGPRYIYNDDLVSITVCS